VAHSEARASAGYERIAATENTVESIHNNEAIYIPADKVRLPHKLHEVRATGGHAKYPAPQLS